MAILYGTQSNGETLPVLVDQFGNLLAKGIDGAPGQPGAEGPPGPDGPPGTDGEGVPKPYGTENQVLTIINSVPAWADPPNPGPSNKTNLQNWNTAGPCTSSEQTYTPDDPEAWCKEQVSWLSADFKANIGLECTGIQDWYFAESFGWVLTMYYNFQGYRPAGDNLGPQYPTITEAWSSPYIDPIGAVYNPPSAEADKRGGFYKGAAQLSSLFRREVTTSTVTQTWDFQAFAQQQRVWWCGWTLEDAGTYALNRQMTFEQRLRDIQRKLASAAEAMD